MAEEKVMTGLTMDVNATLEALAKGRGMTAAALLESLVSAEVVRASSLPSADSMLGIGKVHYVRAVWVRSERLGLKSVQTVVEPTSGAWVSDEAFELRDSNGSALGTYSYQPGGYFVLQGTSGQILGSIAYDKASRSLGSPMP